jgi:sugar phosphate isomerase/epimerase
LTMPLGISTLCTFGRTYKDMGRLLDLGINVLEILEEHKDRLNPARIKKVEELTSSYDVRLTIHSPILDMNIASATRSFRTESVRQVLRSVDNAAQLGAELVVVHPGLRTPLDYFDHKIHWNLNRESLREVLSHAEAEGVKIGVENMPGNHSFLLEKSSEFLDLIDEGLPLQMTLDVGHANTTSQLENYIRDMGTRIAHVHLHDNRGVHDEHLVIGKGTIDWVFLKGNLDMGNLTGVIEANTLSDALQSYYKARQIFNS